MKTKITTIIGGLLLILTGCAALETALAPRVADLVDRYCAEPETARQTIRDALDRHTDHQVRIACADEAALLDLDASDLVGELYAGADVTGFAPGDLAANPVLCPTLAKAYAAASSPGLNGCRNAQGFVVLGPCLAGPMRDGNAQWSVWYAAPRASPLPQLGVYAVVRVRFPPGRRVVAI